MELLKVEVEGLFGIFSHKIAMNDTSNITILLGENGLGKTVLLQMIQAFFNKDFQYINDIEFKVFRLTFDYGDFEIRKYSFNFDVFMIGSLNECNSILGVFELDRKSGGGRRRHLPRSMGFREQVGGEKSTFSDSRSYPSSLSLSGSEIMGEAMLESGDYEHEAERYYDEGIEELKNTGVRRRLYTREIHDPENNIVNLDVLNFLDEIAHFGTSIISYVEQYITGVIYVDDLIAYCNSDSINGCFASVNVKLLGTHRVFQNSARGKNIGDFTSTVSDCAKQLKKQLAMIEREVSNITRVLDASFPSRLMSLVRTGENFTYKEVERSLAKLGSERDELASLGLFVQRDNVEAGSDLTQIESLLYPLHLYVEDTYQKLEPYEKISTGIKLFLEVINERFKHKKIKVDKDRGMVFISTLDSKKTIDFRRLSSGEQHEIVLFFNLVFNSSNNDLILFDEPELSLHVSWQSKFISDFKRVIEGKGVSALIATHSPDIIGKNWDLTCELKGVEE